MNAPVSIPGIPDTVPPALATTDHLPHAYAILSATSAASVDLIEAVRGGYPLPAQIGGTEITENLADALQSAIAIEAADTDPDPERREALILLGAAVATFLEGWIS